jgi:hypothetical protein
VTKEDEEALAVLPDRLRRVIEKRWGRLTPTKAVVDHLLAAGKGGKLIALEADPEKRVAMRNAVFAALDALMMDARHRGEQEISRHSAAADGARASRTARRRANKARDAAIQEEWQRQGLVATKTDRAKRVRRALKAKAKAEKWTLPEVKQIIRIAGGG